MTAKTMARTIWTTCPVCDGAKLATSAICANCAEVVSFETLRKLRREYDRDMNGSGYRQAVQSARKVRSASDKARAREFGGVELPS
jgi:hypothetical protein